MKNKIKIGYGKLLVLLVFGILFINSVIAQAVVCGESRPLFSASNKLYLNEPLNSVMSVIVKNDLPMLLANGEFRGNIDASYTQNIEIGRYPKVVFAKQPTSFNDPLYGLMLSLTSTNYLYKTIITFSRAVDFSNSNSRTQEINLFGVKFIISPTTVPGDLVLLKNAERISLGSNAPMQTVNLGGDSYRIEILSATDTSATIKVTNNIGVSEVKEINERSSKIINGIIVAVDDSDETNIAFGALIVVAKDQIILRDESSVLVGIDETMIEGTRVNIEGGVTGLTKLEILIYAPDSDHDALLPGTAFVDPIFGTFKVDFTGLNIPETSGEREDIIVRNNGEDKMIVAFREHRGNAKEFQWVKTTLGITELVADQDGRKIYVLESELVKRNEYIILGNEDEGYLVKVSTIINQSGTSDDEVEFTDVFSGETYKSSGITTDGQASIVVGGKSYTVRYGGTSSDDTNWVRVDYPDSVGVGNLVIYPTIETSKGAKMAVYANKTINLLNSDGLRNKLSILKLPDGDGFTDVIFTDKRNNVWNINSGITSKDISLNGNDFVSVKVGVFSYRIKGTGLPSEIRIAIENPETGTEINSPALVIFEEKDHNAVYNGMIVTLEPGNTADDGIGVDDVIRTWSNDAEWDSIVLFSDSKKSKEADIYGSIATIDGTDADQKKVFISYPNEQINAMIYINSDNCQPVEKTFIRGDSDRDGRLTMTDAIKILNSIFVGPNTLTCMDAADIDDDGNVNVTDAIRLLNYLFRSGRAPALPYPAAGNDPTADGLSCEN